MDNKTHQPMLFHDELGLLFMALFNECSGVLEKRLTPPTLLEMAILRQFFG